LTDTAWTVALAGTGEVTPENAEKLLDDWLPVEGVALLFPKLPRNAKTMRHLVKWAQGEEIDVHEDQEQLVDALVELRKGGDEVYLVLAWDDTEASSKLLEAALEAEIQVKDLTRALDDLEFEDETDVPAEPVDPPKSRSRRASKQREDTPGDVAEAAAEEPSAGESSVPDAEDVASSDTDTPVHADADVVVQAITTGPATIAPQGVTYVTSESTLELPLSEQSPWIGAHLEAWIRHIIRDEYKLLTAKPEKKSVHALVDQDGNYRLGGKGRPRKGEEAVTLTPTEARAVGLEVEE